MPYGERVREITERFESKIQSEAKGALGIPNVASGGSVFGIAETLTSEERAKQAERFQRVVNETQLARLNKMLNVLDEDILDSAQHYTFVIIDDLDRDWVDDRVANDLIRCLFRTVLDLKRVRHLKVLVALRTNIFEQLEFSNRAGGQEEKFRSLVLNMRWSAGDLESLLDERVRAGAAIANVSFSSVRDLLPPRNRTRGDALEYILNRTLMRPRDAIAYFNECLAIAGGKSRLTWDTIKKAERPYSEKRVLALRDEWKLNYPDIHKVFQLFRGSTTPMTRATYAAKLDDVMLLLADPEFRGLTWLMDLSRAMWAPSDGVVEWRALYGPLTELLYNIGFVGVRSPGQSVQWAHHAGSSELRPGELTEHYEFVVHPMFGPALEIQAS